MLFYQLLHCLAGVIVDRIVTSMPVRRQFLPHHGTGVADQQQAAVAPVATYLMAIKHAKQIKPEGVELTPERLNASFYVRNGDG